MKRCNLIFLLLGFTFLSFGQTYPSDVQYSTITANTPALPALLSSVTDNSVPTDISIKRITEYSNGWYPHHEYSKIQPWNSDATIYKFYSVGIYDADTHQEIGNLPGGQLYPTYWSNTNPDKLWGFQESGDIKSYSVANNTVTTHTHIYFDAANQTDYDLLKLGPGEGNIDKNDKYVAFVGKKNTNMDVIVLDLTNMNIVHKETFAGAWGNDDSAPQYVDWVSVSQSGDFVGIMWNHNETSSDNPFNGHYGVELYNTTDMTYLRRLADYGNHGDFGFAVNGKEVFVQFWGPTGTVNMYYLDGSGRVVLSSDDDFAGEGHISCRNLNRPGWAYISQDEVARSGQIVAMKLDDSGIVEHFGHHFSLANSYLKSPMPVPTPNGDKVMFKSDFGDNGADVIYVFEATVAAPLPVEWLQPLTAHKQDNQVALLWTVAQQINNDKFIVERSADGIHFEAIQTIHADGNFTLRKEFKALDTTPNKGDNYYRIKQIDYDGEFDYSNIAFVRFEPRELSIYPNPATQEIHLDTPKEVSRQIDIFNTTGQLVKQLSQKSTTIPIGDLPKGIYWMRILEEHQSFMKRFIRE